MTSEQKCRSDSGTHAPSKRMPKRFATSFKYMPTGATPSKFSRSNRTSTSDIYTYTSLMFYNSLYPYFGLCTGRRRRRRGRFLLTIRAYAPHAQAVMRGAKFKLLRHLILKVLDRRRKELDHLTALRADHVIVMLMIVMMLVIRFVIAKADLAGETRFCQE